MWVRCGLCEMSLELATLSLNLQLFILVNAEMTAAGHHAATVGQRGAQVGRAALTDQGQSPGSGIRVV